MVLYILIFTSLERRRED